MIDSFAREARAAHKEIMDRQGEDITANGPAKVRPGLLEANGRQKTAWTFAFWAPVRVLAPLLRPLFDPCPFCAGAAELV